MRETVVKHYLNGNSELQIAAEMLILRSSINSIITKYKKQNVSAIFLVEFENARLQQMWIKLYNANSRLTDENQHRL